MDRDLWRCIVAALKALPRRRPRNAVYDSRQVLAVLLWAALHERPICWACRRSNWPPQAWRRALPDQSTMSRRMRDPTLRNDLRALLRRVQRPLPEGCVLITDGKPFPVPEHSRDPEAGNGWATTRYARGYKLHVVIDDAHRVLDWDVRPMNVAESVVTRELVERMEVPAAARLLLGDASYDSNPLHAAAASRGLQLIAPRRKPHTGLGSRPHHPGRLRSLELTEAKDDRRWQALRLLRWEVERFFSRLVSCGSGMSHLPSWVRRLHRCLLWTGAKLTINAIRLVRTRLVHA